MGRLTASLLRAATPAMVAIGAIAPSTVVAQQAPVVLGRTIGEWVATGMQWYDAQPFSTTSECGGRLPTGPVWFLIHPDVPGTYERSCTVPEESHILVPLVFCPWIQTPLDDPTLKEKDWRTIVMDCMKGLQNPVVEVDGQPVLFDPDTPIVRTQTPVFRGMWNADNWLGFDPTYLTGYPMVLDGYYVMLKPLPRGDHLLKDSIELGGDVIFDVTVHLTIR